MFYQQQYVNLKNISALVESGPIDFWYRSTYKINIGEFTENELFIQFTETILNIGWFVNTWNQLNKMLSTIALQTSVIDPSISNKETGMRFMLKQTAYTVQQTVSTYD